MAVNHRLRRIVRICKCSNFQFVFSMLPIKSRSKNISPAFTFQASQVCFFVMTFRKPRINNQINVPVKVIGYALLCNRVPIHCVCSNANIAVKSGSSTFNAFSSFPKLGFQTCYTAFATESIKMLSI